MSRDHTTYRSFERHAEVYGTEGVYGTARQFLGVQYLARLARRLRVLDPQWKLTEEHREELICELFSAGASDQDIAQTVHLGRTAVSNRRVAQSRASESRDSGTSDTGVQVLQAARRSPHNAP